MKKHRVKDKFLEELERTPIIQAACERTGISRQTFYRWINEDQAFALAVEEHMDMGVDFVSDHAESNVLNGIKKGDPGYTKFWLNSRNARYRRPFIHLSQSKLASDKEDERRFQEAEKEIIEWEQRWEANRLRAIQKEAKKLFEEWKKKKKKDSP